VTLLLKHLCEKNQFTRGMMSIYLSRTITNQKLCWVIRLLSIRYPNLGLLGLSFASFAKTVHEMKSQDENGTREKIIIIK
jgi:hypothetical protein